MYIFALKITKTIYFRCATHVKKLKKKITGKKKDVSVQHDGG